MRATCIAIAVLITLFWSGIKCETDHHWNCLRPSQTCENAGTCNATTGGCECTGSFVGFDCGVDGASLSEDPPCAPPCQNGGTCYSDGTTKTCECSADFTGSECQTPRVEILCDGDDVTITFTPLPSFQGVAFVGLDKSNTSCRLTDGMDGTFSGTFARMSSCDVMEETDGADTTYIWFFAVDYLSPSLDFEDPFAFNQNVTCFHSGNSSRSINGGVAPPNPRPNVVPPVTQNYEPGVLELRRFNDFDELVGPRVVLGQRYFLFNFLRDTSVFTALRVENCVVSNSFGRSQALVTDGCVDPDIKQAGLYISEHENERVMSPPGVRYGFRIFRLGRGNSLTFTCLITMCADEADCTLADCSAVTRRRRRAANSLGANRDGSTLNVLDDETQISTVTVTITDPFEEAEHRNADIVTGDGINAESCADEPVIKTTLIALGVVSCVLLLLVVLLITCLIRHRSSVASDKSTTVEEAYSDGSSWFRIPRVKAN